MAVGHFCTGLVSVIEDITKVYWVVPSKAILFDGFHHVIYSFKSTYHLIYVQKLSDFDDMIMIKSNVVSDPFTMSLS